VFSRIVLVLIALLLPAVVGCSSGGGGSDDGDVGVVASFYPLAWAAEQVGGEGVAVTDLTPSGAEPHDLELAASDVKAVRDADLVLYLGGGFQPALERALDGREGRSVDLLAGRVLRTANGVDPHVWLDPRAYAGMVEEIADEIGPETFARAVVSRLQRLDRAYARGLAHCRLHEIVTSHAAFGHLARRYGLTQVPLTGLEPESEPSPRDLERLVREVERSDATTVFFETLVSPKLSETVAREAGVRTAVLNPLEGLTETETAAGEDYVTVMEQNLRELRRALDCT
jgi:zinc transport system substrate-binding protein